MSDAPTEVSRVPTENAPRDCGPCNVCCTAMHVKPLDKPAGQRCAHQTDAGCGIYHERPSVCRTWFCMWVRDTGKVFDPADRPDRLGVFFSASPPDLQTGRQRIYAHEVRPDAAHEPKAARVIDELKSFTAVTVIPFAGDRPAVIPLTINGRAG